MAKTFFEAFRDAEINGLKPLAKLELANFLASSPNFANRAEWAAAYILHRAGRRTLHSYPHELNVRHDVFEHVIGPVLIKGAKENDPESTYWLAMTSYRLSSFNELHKQMGCPSQSDLWGQAYALDPKSERVREGYLSALITGFDYCDHEWPSGLLVGEHEQWTDINREIAMARRLDSKLLYRDRLNQFEMRARVWFNRS